VCVFLEIEFAGSRPLRAEKSRLCERVL
jgi:hypothetical protein